jgi:hypothetical protein
LLLAKREEKRGIQIKLHDEEFHKLYSLLKIISTNEIRRMGWSRHVKRIADEINTWPSTQSYSCDRKIWPYVLRDSKPKMIVLARASRKLPDQRNAHRALVENLKDRDY